MIISPLDSLIPVGGWQYYSKYINQKIGFLGDTTIDNQLVLRDKFGNKLDDLDIEFSLNKEGKTYYLIIINNILYTNHINCKYCIRSTKMEY